jgi:hypothetical protein
VLGLALAAMILLAAMTGCLNPAGWGGKSAQPAAEPVPPAARINLRGRLEAMTEAAPAVRLLLFAWFADEFPEAPAASLDLARLGYEEATRELLAAARQDWIERSGGLLTDAARGRLTVSAKELAVQNRQADFVNRLRRLAEADTAPPEAAPALADCLADTLWPETMRPARERFAVWYRQREGRLRLPPLPSLDVVQRDVAQLLAATAVRERLLEGLLAVEELERRRLFPSAMDKLEDVLADPQAIDALRTLRDEDTPRRLAEKRQFLPQSAVSAECEILRRHHAEPLARAATDLTDPGHREDTNQRLEALENRLSLRLDEWRQDERFALALPRYASEFENLIRTAFLVRLALWEAELRAVPEPLRAWQQFELLQPWLASLRDYRGPGGEAYRYLDSAGGRAESPSRNSLRAAEERLLPIYTVGLPDAFAAWREFAERQVSLHLHHGVDLAVAGRITEMLSLFREDDLTAVLRDHLRWARERTAVSLERFRTNGAACSIRIEPFASDTPGQGMTWARDLETRLRELLAQAGHQPFAQVVPVGEEGSQLPRSLAVTRGRIANFGADETSEKAAIREVVELGEPKPVNNGHLQPAYTQTVSRRAIHAVTTERVAHIRVGCQIQSNGNAEDIEVNRFYRKQFVQESSHPFLDVAVIETRQADRRADLAPASEPVELRSDRLWTPSEMLDWSRRLALDEMAGEIIHRLDAFPLELVNRARQVAQAGDWPAAADAWGYASAYLSQLQPIRNPNPDLPAPATEVQARQREIEAWRSEARRQMNEALRRVLAEPATPGAETVP